MNEIGDLDEAISIAEEKAEHEDGGTEKQSSARESEAALINYVDRLRSGQAVWEEEPERIARYAHLVELLLALGLDKAAMDLTDTTLRAMRLSEIDQVVYREPELWNHLGSLLAEQGDLVRAMAVLDCALTRAHEYETYEVPAILANLSVVSLQLGDPDAAAIWANKALDSLKYEQDKDLETRLTADRVRLDLARASGDEQELHNAVDSFDQSVTRFVESEGGDHARALGARVALAAARHDLDPSLENLAALELLYVTAQVTLGLEHRETIIAQATLAATEFAAAGGWDGQADERTEAAVQAFVTAAARAVASPDLGQEHPQTHILQDELADMRAAITPDDKLPYHIERVYRPHQNTERNDAKRKALEEETGIIRLIAHAGASYFLKETRLFYGRVKDALERGVRFNVVISSPWNSLAAFMPHDSAAEPGNYQNIVELVESSPSYNNTFLPVVESYQLLKSMYPDLIELRITSLDVSGSTLLTSNVGFFEPYITSNPQRRTRRGMSVFEVEFRKDSRYYADSLEEFRAQWELSSTWKEFETNQEQHKAALRSEMGALASVRMRASVRRGEVPLP
ncbi:hypothetical protein [Streptomyces canus]|uniref:hypothetical protein n=1 Tax=Streptomyces canus TaxID=58343 RepID=UPI002E2C4CB5|nr:hypothetical protein [Streptomyces canus]